MRSRHITIAATFIWIGFVCAISFMEAWIKFRVPGVTLVTGLAIGQLVFSALNKVEIALAAAIIVSIVLGEQRDSHKYLLVIVITTLAIQTFFLLPQLSQRVDTWLSGKTPGPSHLHVYYVSAEAVKVIVLLVYGFKKLMP